METISSSLTFFFKFVFAALWSGAFGLGTVTIFFNSNADVSQNRWINLRPITLTLKRQTPFGRAVTFMPRRSFRLFSEDEIVTRLRRLANIGVQRSVLT
jgi:hypothetical protein